MSTTRWIIETPCQHGWDDERRHWLRADGTNTLWPSEAGNPPWPEQQPCPGMSRLVVDPDNLPPEAIQRAKEALIKAWRESRPETASSAWTPGPDLLAEAAVRALLSDPEPGDQT